MICYRYRYITYIWIWYLFVESLHLHAFFTDRKRQRFMCVTAQPANMFTDNLVHFNVVELTLPNIDGESSDVVLQAQIYRGLHYSSFGCKTDKPNKPTDQTNLDMSSNIASMGARISLNWCKWLMWRLRWHVLAFVRNENTWRRVYAVSLSTRRQRVTRAEQMKLK